MNRPALGALILVLWAPALSAQEGIPPLPDGVEMATRPSGLRVAVLQKGDEGAKPERGDKVRVFYKGWLADGTVFDQRPAGGEPAEFTCGGLIAGWNEALQEMTPGARWRIECPPDLAYGAEGRPPRIPAAATLTFELELVSVSKAPKFVDLDPEKSQTTESGVRYQILAAGEGVSPTEEQIFKLGYAIWDANGRLLDSTFLHDGTIDGRVEDMRVPFLKEIPLAMKPGSEWIVEAKLAQAFPDGAPPAWGELPAEGLTTWRLELRAILIPLPVPEFAPPSDEGSTKLENGLVFEVLREGEGDPPGPLDVVACHYAGWLPEGELFDSSYPRGEPLRIRGAQVIPGWTEALRRMKPGAVWRVKVPPELGYGAAGSPPVIPGNATLIFHIELVEVVERQ